MTSADEQRYVYEQPKDSLTTVMSDSRSPFSRDRARVLHSAAFRRLAAKTQVHTVSDEWPGQAAMVGMAHTDAFPRTRLTHSLEVAQIAREMGAALGADPEVVDTAGLAHDLGHPPFGHNGEAALNQMAQDCGGFEGNAQTLRVLTRLEAKVTDPQGRSAGLNLTRASLDACVKYPWLRTTEHRKFGVYRDDEPVFSWLRAASSHPHRRCVEAQVMDWADDVAYSVHDVEDAIHSGDLTLGVLRDDHDERAALCADVAAVYSGESVTDLAAVLDELLDDPILVPLATYDGSHASLVALKRLTSVLTGRFVAAAVHATAAASDGGPVRRYGSDLLVPRRIRAECALLKGLALRYVLRRPGAQHRYQWEQEIVVELVEGLMREAPKVLDPVFRSLWFAASDDRERLRVIIDQVSSLTDPAAVAWHHRLTAGSGAR